MGMEVDQANVEPEAGPSSDVTPDYSAAKTGLTCLPQRAALLKSMLNFLKKAIQVKPLLFRTVVSSNRLQFQKGQFLGTATFGITTFSIKGYSASTTLDIMLSVTLTLV